MNLRKVLFTGLAAVGLMASLAAPALAAPPEDTTANNVTNALVTVGVTGSFDVYFTAGSFYLETQTLGAAAPEGVAEGSLTIGYLDTLPNRPNFNVTMISDHFSDGAGHSIQNTGYTVTHTYEVAQGQWGNIGGGGPNGPLTYDVGDIGYFQNNDYVGQGAGAAWTSNNVLNNWTTVQFGYAGVGTIWSTGVVDVALVVPATTVAGSYSALMTLNVVAGTEP